MKLSIVGTGYVGLVTGACFAEKGHDVTCVDLDIERIAALNAGESPIFEPGLAELIARHAGHRLRATCDVAAAVRDSDVTFITVGTPFNGATIDLGAVLRAARSIGEALQQKTGYHLVVVKSTVVPGTTDQRVLPALELASGRTAGEHFGVAMNPEFLSQGEAVHDFMFPDRIVLGGNDARALARLAEVYAPFPEAPRLETNTRTAELIKYAANSLLATLISFANEIANLGSTLGDVDPSVVMRGVQLSQYFRVRPAAGLPPITAFLQPGCGFGGSCLPKDVRALAALGRSLGEPLPILEAVIATNDRQPLRIVSLLERHWPELADVRVTVLGLAFKPQTNDVRETPALPIVSLLLERGAHVTAFDPVANRDFQRAFPDPRVHYAPSLETAIAGAEAIVVVTPWPEFSTLPDRLLHLPAPPLVVDSRRTFSAARFAHYVGIGD